VQLPPYVTSSDQTRTELERILRRLSPARVAVEFRHRSWVAKGELEQARDLLERNGAAWVCVDAPRIDVASAMPPLALLTSPALAYVRMHGRNGDTWQGSRTVAERFDHSYTDDELDEWLDPVLEMAVEAQEVAVVFNNNSKDNALVSAARFATLLGQR
jgi:uncharacterized protein YecE (DUF72 family)